MVRNTKREALTRMEDAARTVEDFQEVIEQWDRLDRNRQRRARAHEIGRTNEDMLHWDRVDEEDEKGKLKEGLDTVLPRPLNDLWWRQHIRGEFLDEIYDNSQEIWQLVEDWDIAALIKKGLTDKQRDTLFLSAVRLCTPQQIACYQEKTDRAVRKLFAAALTAVRDRLVTTIREKIAAEVSDMTWMKRIFLTWYTEPEIPLDKPASQE